MTSAENKGVFLSYASQDAAAVARIAEALRAAGVEVWFDQNELVGGDAWDKKIRQQIKECAIFVPVISANTQARPEGYFRLEWLLAVERSRLMSDDHPFLFPVVIDDTTDAAARVPDRFRDVQWTRLDVKDTPESLAARVAKILGRSGAGPIGDRAPVRQPDRQSNPAKRTPWLAFAGVGLATIMALAFWQPWGKPTPAVATAARVSEARQRVFRARELFGNPNYIRDDLSLAEDLCKQALALDPNDAEVWAIYAELSSEFIGGGTDVSPERHELARTQAERAVKLAPQSTETRFAKASYLRRVGGTSRVEAEKILRELAVETPNDPRVLISLGKAIWGNVGATQNLERANEALAVFARAAALPAGRAEALGESGWLLFNLGRYAEAEPMIDESLGLRPSKSAAQSKVILALARGDLAMARTSLAKLHPDVLRSDLGASIAARVWLWSHEPDKCLEALSTISRDFLSNSFYRGPTEFLRAWAYLLAGKQQAANSALQAALQVVDKRLADQPRDQDLLMIRAYVLALLGQRDAAMVALHLHDELYPATGKHDMGGLWIIAVHALLDPPDRAIELLETFFKDWPSTLLKDDPRFDTLRGHPRFEALRARIEAAPGVSAAGAGSAVIIDDKSVAVLAFENLSDDKTNEYFSDGIAGELLTTLQKIPGLRVAARTSAFSFKGKHATAQEVGEKLGMAHIVEGTVQKSGNRVKITARLSKAAKNEEMWSKSFGPLELTDVFATQSEIAQAVVAELRGRLTGEAAAAQAEVAKAQKGGTKNPEAHALYLQGRFHEAQYTRQSIRPAVASFRQAVDLDPNFALAWAALAGAATSHGEFNYGVSDRPLAEALTESRKAAEKSLALEPQLAEGHLALMQMQWFERDWKGARASARRALELAPSDAKAVAAAADIANVFGDYPQALELATRAVALDPLSAPVRFSLVSAHWDAGRLKEAEAEIRRLLTVNPGALNTNLMLGLLVVLQGRPDEAAAIVERETDEVNRNVGLALARWGQQRRPEADAALQAVIKQGGGRVAFQIAEIYGYRGDVEQGYVWLERAYQQRDVGLTYTPVDRFLLPLRADPRWPAFLRKIGLSEEQLK